MMQNIGIDYHCFVGERERSERLLKKKHFFCLLESVLWFVQLFGKKLQPQSFAKGISPFLVFQFIKCFFFSNNKHKNAAFIRASIKTAIEVCDYNPQMSTICDNVWTFHFFLIYSHLNLFVLYKSLVQIRFSGKLSLFLSMTVLPRFLLIAQTS